MPPFVPQCNRSCGCVLLCVEFMGRSAISILPKVLFDIIKNFTIQYISICFNTNPMEWL